MYHEVPGFPSGSIIHHTTPLCPFVQNRKLRLREIMMIQDHSYVSGPGCKFRSVIPKPYVFHFSSRELLQVKEWEQD